MHRLSTNVKLAQIINSKNNDEEEEEAVLNNENLAKQRLRRSALYDGGARYCKQHEIKLIITIYYNK